MKHSILNLSDFDKVIFAGILSKDIQLLEYGESHKKGEHFFYNKNVMIPQSQQAMIKSLIGVQDFLPKIKMTGEPKNGELLFKLLNLETDLFLLADSVQELRQEYANDTIDEDKARQRLETLKNILNDKYHKL